MIYGGGLTGSPPFFAQDDTISLARAMALMFDNRTFGNEEAGRFSGRVGR